MGVQFNLLPDVKLEFNRQQRTKHFAYIVCILAGSIALGLFVISFIIVNVLQKQLLSSTSNDIKKYSSQLQKTPGLQDVLTIQNQLTTLPKLHSSKHITSRFMSYLPQITPNNVFVAQVNLDMNAHTMTISGTADTLETINKFVDTLKFTKVVSGGGSNTTSNNSNTTSSSSSSSDTSNQALSAFTNVVLTSSGRSTKTSNYTISATFDPSLFDESQVVVLQVPQNTITTRSVTNTPNLQLFNGDTGKPNDSTKQGSQ